MIAFDMQTVLIKFEDKYYNYKGVVKEDGRTEEKDDNTLAPGAFEAAFCMDTGATCIYEMCEEIIEKLMYAGTYCDYGLMIF
eukprot:3478550-Ditylum_brightwellii.AAC.1